MARASRRGEEREDLRVLFLDQCVLSNIWVHKTTVFGVEDLDYLANGAWFLKNCGLMLVEFLLYLLLHRLASLLFSLFLLFNSFVTYIIKFG